MPRIRQSEGIITDHVIRGAMLSVFVGFLCSDLQYVFEAKPCVLLLARG